MALSDFTGLSQAIRDWLHRSDLTDAQITDFINLGEQRLNRLLRLPDMLSVTTLAIGTDGRVDLPSDFLDSYLTQLSYKADGTIAFTLEELPIDEYEERKDWHQGPTWFTRIGSRIYIAPTPDATTYDCQLTYYARPAFLSSTNPTNLWTQIAFDALLFASLSAARGFVMDDQRSVEWEKRFQMAVRELQLQRYDQGAAFDKIDLGGLP